MSRAPAIVVLSKSGSATAEAARRALSGAAVHGLRGRVDGADVRFSEVGEHLRGLFRDGTPIIGVCAAGILIRSLGPLLDDKSTEPPVVAVAEDGSAVVPLLGGHRGANRLARTLATALGCPAAITTAGDLQFGVALDDPPPGFRLANPEAVKPFTAALLKGASVTLDGTAAWLEESRLPCSEGGRLSIRVTERIAEGSDEELIYHPQTLAVGVGCERRCSPDELTGLVRQTLVEAELAEAAIAVVVSLDLKADEPAVHAVGEALDKPVRFFGAETLDAETSRLAHPSDLVFREVGCHGVAEAAALAAAGQQGELIVPKHKSRRATCAVARAPSPLDPERIGRRRGHLAILGIGPGSAEWRTPEASTLLAEATDLVGYDLYLDLLGNRADGKRSHRYPLGKERERARAALDLAAEGRDVALISSGDAGIYAMAAVVFELIDREPRPDWRRIAVTVAPGISALQAAAARCGAPLGHDFCAISLSDLLTPWDVIERRLRAAAEGDFVIALYNPASQRRRRHLTTAREILLAHRPPETPVMLASRLGRAGETVRSCTLETLNSDEVDMLTIVLVGSSETRRIDRRDGGHWIYTPRGYKSRAAR